MLEFIGNADHHKQEERIVDYHDTPCIICGRGVKDPWKYTVHIYWGTTLVTAEEIATLPDDVLPQNADLGCWPIGADCLKKHPEIVPYLIKEK
jgi:hypothetical protein